MENSGFLNSFFNLFCCRSQKSQNLASESKKNKFFDTFLQSHEIVSVFIINVNKIQKPPFGDLEVYCIKVQLDDYQYTIEKKFRDFLNFKEEIEKIIGSQQGLELPNKEISLKYEQEMLLNRKEKLNIFLANIMKVYKNVLCKELYEFFEIFENYEKKQNVYDSSFQIEKMNHICLTNEDRELIQILINMNTSPNERIFFFKKIKAFLLGNKASISSQIKEILFNGYYELEGLIEICGKYSSDPHIICCSGLDLLYSLCDHEQNKEAEVYISLFSKLSAKDFSKLNLGSHIMSIPAKNCKKIAMKLLQLYKESNPQANPFLLSQILNNEDAYNEFEKWKSSSTIISQKTEFFEVDIDECKEYRVPPLSLMMNINEGKKRSTLYRKQKKNRPLLILDRNQSN